VPAALVDSLFALTLAKFPGFVPTDIEHRAGEVRQQLVVQAEDQFKAAWIGWIERARRV
jgi:hypothetical protein